MLAKKTSKNQLTLPKKVEELGITEQDVQDGVAWARTSRQ